MGPISDWIEVLDVCGEHLMWTDELTAHEYVRAGEATVRRRRGRTRVIQALPGSRLHRVELSGRGDAFDHTQYSHTHESETNPPRVWTLLRLGINLEPLRG